MWTYISVFFKRLALGLTIVFFICRNTKKGWVIIPLIR